MIVHLVDGRVTT